MKTISNYFYKKFGFLLARSPKWEYIDYGFYPDGIGDLISRSVIAGLVHTDPSMVQNCVTLLRSGKRWPDSLCPPSPYPDKYPGQISASATKLNLKIIQDNSF